MKNDLLDINPESLSKETSISKLLAVDFSDLLVTWKWLTLGDQEFFQLNDKIHDDTCHLFFCLNGNLTSLNPPLESLEILNIPYGCCSFIYQPCSCHCRICEAMGQARIFHIQFSGRNFLRLMGSQGLGHKLRLAGLKEHPLMVVHKTTPVMQHILRQMRDISGKNDENSLFWMAKTMELIWLFSADFERSTRNHVNAADRRLVQQAQVILETRIADPPSLEELAGLVGMGLSKLKQVFPMVCGRTPYAYLRQVRMEKAMYLIRSSDKSVTEVAFEVGYNSLSRFSKSFATLFGVKPSEMRRKHCP